MTEHSVRIVFPNKKSLKRFMGWMSDGGGEYQFFESEDNIDPPEERITGFEYAEGPDGKVIVAGTEADMD